VQPIAGLEPRKADTVSRARKNCKGPRLNDRTLCGQHFTTRVMYPASASTRACRMKKVQ
jgi:hypothetical protein